MANLLHTQRVQLFHPIYTQLLGATLSRFARKNDNILLFGSVGVGKSEFARGYIRHALSDKEMIVCSPTFMIEQQYYHPKGGYSIHHIDLYRLQPSDPIPIDLEEGVNIIEWAENLGDKKYSFLNRLEIAITVEKESSFDVIENEDIEDEFDVVGHHSAQLSFYGDHWHHRIPSISRTIEELNKATSFNPKFIKQFSSEQKET